jgi:hypothetical protein
MVETKGAFQQSKCQHEDNDGIPYVPKHFAKHELSFLVDHPFERLDPRIGHTKSPVVMADHGIDAAIARPPTSQRWTHRGVAASQTWPHHGRGRRGESRR